MAAVLEAFEAVVATVFVAAVVVAAVPATEVAVAAASVAGVFDLRSASKKKCSEYAKRINK